MGKNKQLDKTSVDAETPSDNEDDPLFKKYSRKTFGRSRYTQENVQPDINGEIALRPATLTTGLAPYTGIWSEDEALHFVRRTTYGAKKTLVDSLVPMGASAAIDSLLVGNMNAATLPSQFPLVYYNYPGGLTEVPGVSQGQTWVNTYLYSPYSGENHESYRTGSNTLWHIGLALEDNTIREKMVQFWYHFIPINTFDLIIAANNDALLRNVGNGCYEFMDIFRTHGLGNFKT